MKDFRKEREFTALKNKIARQSLVLIFLVIMLGVLNGLGNKTESKLPTSSGIGTLAQPFVPSAKNSQPVQETRALILNQKESEVFGFAPYWTFNKLDNVDFETLTTLAYFSITVSGDGNLDKGDQGYATFKGKRATEVFQKAHDHRARVVLTLTQMNNWQILAILDDPEAQERVIEQAVSEVQDRGIDGINVDFEYDGNPGPEYRDKFTKFVTDLTEEMHKANPDSKVTVSVYAASVKDPKIYDIGALSKVSDGIFMMAYDFAGASSDIAMPTAPLHGDEDGTYWYDVSSAVDDFLKVMPADKLILGVPWYGYNYPVYQPDANAATGWGAGISQTYALAKDNINPDKEGWDDKSKVGWKAYLGWDGWRMIFLEDQRSLGIKYDFAKEKNLAGVGIWALGFDEGKEDLWKVLKEKFG